MPPDLVELQHRTEGGVQAPWAASYAAGLEHLRNRQLLPALEALKLAIKAPPQVAAPFAAMGYIYEMQDASVQASECYQKALLYDENWGLPRRGLIRSYLGLNQLDAAGREVIKLADSASLVPDDLFLTSQYVRAADDRESECSLYERLLQLDPDHAVAADRYACRLIEKGKPEAAVQVLWKALGHDPLAEQLWQRLAKLNAVVTEEEYQRQSANQTPKSVSSRLNAAGIASLDMDALKKHLDADIPISSDTTFADGVLALAQIALAEGVRVRDQPATAKALLLFALHAFRCLAMRKFVAEVYIALARVGLRQALPEAALRLAQFAVEAATELGDGQLEEQAHLILAQVHRHRNELCDASRHYATAIECFEEVRQRIHQLDARGLYIGSRSSSYEEQVITLLDMDLSAQALEFVERSKARDLVDLLGNHKITVRSGADVSLLEQDERCQQELIYLERQSGELLWQVQNREGRQSDLDGRNRRQLEEDRRNHQVLVQRLSETRQELAFIKQQIRENAGEWASLKAVKPLLLGNEEHFTVFHDDLTSLFSAGDDKIAVLEFFVTDKETYIFLLPCWNGDFARLMIARSDLSRSEIARIAREDFTQSLQDLSAPPVFLEQLYERLFIPIESRLKEIGADVLLFAPHDLLHVLPLHAMFYRSAQDQCRFLVEDYACGYVPSLSVLQLLQDKRTGRGTGAFVAGNPTGDLDRAEEEVMAVAAFFGEDAHLREEATEARVLTESLNKEVIHLACHSRFDAEDALQSCLVLADGLLQVDEVLDMTILATLVTLSSCSSGVNRVSRGDELVGLSRAWLYAGSPSVIGSLWDVAEGSTSQLMISFYEHWRSGDCSKVRALQRAQVQWLEKKHSSPRRNRSIANSDQHGFRQDMHPYWWSPVILMGDPL